MGIRKLAIVCALLAASLSARAWDRIGQPASELPSDFYPTFVSAPDANGFWSFGYDGQVLVRYSNAGVPLLVRYPQSQYQADYVQLAAGSDGSVVLGFVDGFSNKHCVLRGYDASGALRWSNEHAELAAGLTQQGQCNAFQLDGSGGVWIRGSKVARLARDGAVDVTVSYDALEQLNGIVADPAGSNVYLFGAMGTSGSTRALVEKISSHGDTLWRWQAPATDGSSAASHLVVGGDGNLYAFGASSAAASSATLYGARLSPSGQLAWSHVFMQTALGENGQAAALPGGGAYVLPGDVLLRIDSQGQVSWSRSANVLDDCHLSDVRASANGDAILDAGCASNDTGNVLALLRYDSTGAMTFSTRLASSYYQALQVLSDGTSVLVAEHNPSTDGGGIVPRPPTFLHHAGDGTLLTPPRTARIVAAADVLAASAIDSDGSTYLLSAGGGGYSLMRTMADGSVRWRVHGDGDWGPYHTVKLVVAGDAVCWVGIRDTKETAQCNAISDGAVRGRADLGDGVSAYDAADVTYARALGDGQIVVVYSYAYGFNVYTDHVLLRNDASEVHHVPALNPNEYLGGASINAAGDSLLITGSQSFARFDVNGKRVASGTFDAALGHIDQTFLTDDGVALLVSQTPDKVLVSRVSADGMPLWTHTLLSSATLLTNQRLASMQAHGGDFYIALGIGGLVFTDSDAPQQITYGLQKLSLADGSAQWGRDLTDILFAFPQLRLNEVGQRLLVVSEWPSKIHTRLLDTRDGTLLDERFDGCINESCHLSASAVTADGTLRVATDTAGDSSGNRRALLERLHAFDTAAPVAVAQPGVTGAWYASYASGQGFTLDYIASAKTLFMPWFTYAKGGGNDPGGLAWYGLQGTADANATSSELTITSPAPGTFASSAVDVRAVGSARLSFADCNSGTLSYQFNSDVNGGATGVISLARVTPSSSACTLSDGSVNAAQAPAPPSQGFDANQSGSWFDPATSGQGLQITVLPPGGGSNGLLFAAWFTFDPSGQSDDPAHQHWFTLQGDLANASDGEVSVPILRTIGGSFDAMPTGNTVRVGQATLSFKGCDSAVLDYEFDRSDVAHAFAGLSGSIALSKIGGCATP